MPITQEYGEVSKTINGVPGYYKEDQGTYSFKYNDNGRTVMIFASSYELIEEVSFSCLIIQD